MRARQASHFQRLLIQWLRSKELVGCRQPRGGIGVLQSLSCVLAKYGQLGWMTDRNHHLDKHLITFGVSTPESVS